MDKKLIHTQEEALSVYFRDMLNAPLMSAPSPEAAAKINPTITTPEADRDTSTVYSQQVTETAMIAPVSDVIPQTSKYLLCDVAGLPIALELLSLNNIIHWPEDGLINVPGQPGLVLGLLNQHGQQSLVLDINMLLHSEQNQPAKRQYKFLLLFDKRRHAIACDHIDQIMLLTPEQINWRNQPQQPWFKGIITEHMHSIIDLPVILQRLLEEE